MPASAPWRLTYARGRQGRMRHAGQDLHPAAASRPRLYEGWERAGAFACDPNSNADALHHHDPAAERHRQPAYGSCADLHHPGHADPLAADAGARCAVAARHRPCRDRHADGGGAAAGRAGRRIGASWGATAFVERVWQWKAESGGTITQQLRRLGAVAGLAARALHHGRWAVGRGAGGVRHAVPRRA